MSKIPVFQLIKNLWQRKSVRIFTGISGGLCAIMLVFLYLICFSPNIRSEKPVYFYISRGSSFEQVVEKLTHEKLIRSEQKFRQVSDWLSYTHTVKSGKYKLMPDMSTWSLVRLLRSGKQEPVKIHFENARTKTELAEQLDEMLDLHRDELLTLLEDKPLLDSLGFNSQTVISLFIPNTYEVYWDIEPMYLIEKMYAYYKQFWDNGRKSKAASIPLTPQEVSTLASIVQAESYQTKERPTIAGVYINRIRTNMPLQADPTVVFAWNDFTINRVLNSHLTIDSPYNTYRHKGLPPGPINCPSINAIDAVLNYEKHNYLYFCAKEDFSGYHNYATNYQDHLTLAARYQQALNKAKKKKK
ncbi:MAG: endolytic transglycosylase MltG [Bacteroidia bacterium]|nr:endolytic transglycosylase MltG [Bacteroidia bacterium]